jgi:hypothetical protein
MAGEINPEGFSPSDFGIPISESAAPECSPVVSIAEQGQLSFTEYKQYREFCDKAELEVSGRFDHWMLTLPTGALALSITFIHEIAPLTAPHTIGYLIYSWVSFTISLLCALSSLLTSQHAIHVIRNELDGAFKNKRAPSNSYPKLFARSTNWLNWIALFTFICGVVLLCNYSFSNMQYNKKVVRYEESKQNTGR